MTNAAKVASQAIYKRFNLAKLVTMAASVVSLIACSGLQSAQAGEKKYFGNDYDTSFTQMTHYEADEPYPTIEPHI